LDDDRTARELSDGLRGTVSRRVVRLRWSAVRAALLRPDDRPPRAGERDVPPVVRRDVEREEP
jgi:hypothetical protein